MTAHAATLSIPQHTTPKPLRNAETHQSKRPWSALWRIGLTICLATGTAVGCSSEERVNTASVLANANCKGAQTGVAEVTFADVARLRGSQLVALESTTSEASTGTSEEAALPLLVALSRGPQPSRGFELHLADQARVVSATSLAIDVYWSEPDLSKPQPLVTTHPCLVVSVPKGPWQTIEAIDQHGASLGILTRAASSAGAP